MTYFGSFHFTLQRRQDEIGATITTIAADTRDHSKGVPTGSFIELSQETFRLGGVPFR